MRNFIQSLIPLALLWGTAACNSADPEPGPEVVFGTLVEILGDSTPGAALVANQPASFLVCDVSAAEHALRFRAQWSSDLHDSELNTIFDVSPFGALERASFGDLLMEPALESPGSGLTSLSPEQTLRASLIEQ
ncbi:MAG: hypothetical protein O3A20_00400 [Planctomycetota bacterium]|nr:hypothetical protein [Planctomycetota bacterium]